MAASARLNLEVFRKKIATSKKKLEPLVFANAERRLTSLKNRLLDNFEDHPVTKEILAGPEAKSTILPKGNLFSFIGFPAGSDPISELRLALWQSIQLSKTARVRGSGNRLLFSYRITTPSKSVIEEATPMPEWSSGSWAYKIERGISGLERYLFGSFNSSRSGSGIQTKKDISPGSFSGVAYISEILKQFFKDASTI